MQNSQASVHSPTTNDNSTHVRFDWLRASITSGFIATFAMTVSMAIAFGMANAFGDANGNAVQQNLFALTSNELTQEVGDALFLALIGNIIMGIVWAIIYARLFEPRFDGGPGWQKGIWFSLIPWILSILVFFPLAGVGMLGTDLQAGGFPVLGNLVLHAIYGAVLGWMYAIEEDSADVTDPDFTDSDRQANANAERGAAVGIFVGGIGGGVGGWLVGPSMNDLASETVIIFIGAFTLAAFGMLIGSFLGVHVEGESR
jgi:hypothetical protein